MKMSTGSVSRRRRQRAIPLAGIVLVAIFIGLSGCGGSYEGPPMIVLGFDGMDYELTKKMIAEGRLPNLARLAESGSFTPLETSIPPESPVAWSNFITGTDSGGHGIFDFVHRDPKTLLPFASDARTTPDKWPIHIGRYRIPLISGGFEPLRKGQPFWEVLEQHGIESWVLRMPANYPTSGSATRELSGMGTPDLKGASFFSFYTSELFYPTEGISGGEVYEWDVYDNVAEQLLYAADNPYLEEKEKLSTPFRVYIDSDEPAAMLEIGDEKRILRLGEWSDWVPVEFEIMPTSSIHGIARFYLKAIEPELELYVTPINFDPMAPDAPISTPADFATELAEHTGRFYTQGMPEDTKAFTGGVLELDQFVEQAREAGREIVEQFDWVLENFDGGFLFYYLGNVDQMSHAMWASMDPEHPQYDPETYGRYADLIPSLYEGLDAMVGKTLEEMPQAATLVVMSDHGFSTWRRSFNLNTWLVENGYMTLKDPDRPDPGLFQNTDWSRTKAYGMGINGLFVNLRGRERDGIVEPGERRALLEEIGTKLKATIDPATGQPAVSKTYIREDIYEDRGELVNGPDMQMGYTAGTRGSGKGALGDIEPEFLRHNTDDWTGDHIMDHTSVPGVLFVNKKLQREAPSLESLAPALLAEMGIASGFPPPIED